VPVINLDLSSKQVENIVGFLGYGNPTKSVWFVGIEEGLGGATTEDALENLKERSSFKEIMDLRDAHHLRLRDKGGLIDFDKKPPHPPAWQRIAKIMCASGVPDWKAYLQESLGRDNRDTFLTELSPIPTAKAADKAWMHAIQHVYGDLSEMIHRRRKRLLQLLENERPRLVVCYGDGEAKAREYAEFWGIKWTKTRSQISRASTLGCPFLLLPFFGLGKMSQSVLSEMLQFEDPPVRAIILKGRNGRA
jgi:hypothetical protein